MLILKKYSPKKQQQQQSIELLHPHIPATTLPPNKNVISGASRMSMSINSKLHMGLIRITA